MKEKKCSHVWTSIIELAPLSYVRECHFCGEWHFRDKLIEDVIEDTNKQLKEIDENSKKLKEKMNFYNLTPEDYFGENENE